MDEPRVCVHCGHRLTVLHTSIEIREPPDYVPVVSFKDIYYHVPSICSPLEGNICSVVKKKPIAPPEAEKSWDAYISWVKSLNLEEYYCMCKNPEPDLR